MNAFWEPVGEVRLPLVSASAETLTAIEKSLGTVQDFERFSHIPRWSG